MRSGYRKTNDSNIRFIVLRIFIIFAALILLGQLFNLQVVQNKNYSALAVAQHEFSSVLTPERGRILVQQRGSGDDQYFPVAINRIIENLALSPKLIAGNKDTSEKLSQITGKDITEIKEILKLHNKQYHLLQKDLSEEQVEQIKAAKLKGVWLETQTIRYYPENDFLAHALGFLGYTDNSDTKTGVYGLERMFEEELHGREGYFQGAANSTGSMVLGDSRKLVPAQHGSDLVLTINHAIQAEVERVLERYVNEFGAESGSIIVTDAKTGAVWAMASIPKFNPNDFSKVEDVQVFSNPLVQSRYEPGSIIKPLTISVALETDKIEPDDTYVDTGSVVIDGHTIKNSDGKSYGEQTMTQVLEKSLNTGMVHVQKLIGKETFKKYFMDFGFSETTKISLPWEISGNLANLDAGNQIAYATASFGQGISMTPVEIIRAYTAVTNKGMMMKPYIVSEILHPDGSREVVKPQEVRKVISERTAAQVGSMMVNVVENGHGKRAGVQGYYIAGKTGTAQVPSKDKRGYDPDKSIGSFIGFGPVEDPRFLMLVKIDNPKGVRFAESTAAPAFGEIAKFILNYLQVPPTRDVN